MTRPPRPLPPELAAGPFLVEDAAAAGVSRGRLRAADLARTRHGLYVPAGSLDTADGPLWHPRELAAYQRRHPDAVVSGPSAARLLGLTLPERALWSAAVHVSVGPGGRPRQAGLVPHRARVPPGHRTVVEGVTVTTAPRTLWDLCGMLPWLGERDVVVAGDALVAPPWLPGGGRGRPAHTLGELHRVLEERGSFRGVRRARAALQRIRVGADSPQETRLRLALVDAGLPEPVVQCPLDPADRFAPVADLAYPAWRLVLQYEGASHRTREPQERDVRRDRWCEDRRWLVLKVVAADRVGDYRSVADRVRRRAAEFG